MVFDALVANPGRLRILTALAAGDCQDFVQLRRTTALSDGNLASHARRLSSAGFIAVEKEFRAGKPVTRFTLTHTGRSALESHAHQLLAAIGGTPRKTSTPSDDEPPMTEPASIDEQEEWVD